MECKSLLNSCRFPPYIVNIVYYCIYPEKLHMPPTLGTLLFCGMRHCRLAPVPGHAFHGKGLRGQRSVGPLVSSLEQRALVVPLIDRSSTARYVPSSVYIGFLLFVLLGRRSGDVSLMLWGVRGTLVS